MCNVRMDGRWITIDFAQNTYINKNNITMKIRRHVIFVRTAGVSLLGEKNKR